MNDSQLQYGEDDMDKQIKRRSSSKQRRQTNVIVKTHYFSSSPSKSDSTDHQILKIDEEVEIFGENVMDGMYDEVVEENEDDEEENSVNTTEILPNSVKSKKVRARTRAMVFGTKMKITGIPSQVKNNEQIRHDNFSDDDDDDDNDNNNNNNTNNNNTNSSSNNNNNNNNDDEDKNVGDNVTLDSSKHLHNGFDAGGILKKPSNTSITMHSRTNSMGSLKNSPIIIADTTKQWTTPMLHSPFSYAVSPTLNDESSPSAINSKTIITFEASIKGSVEKTAIDPAVTPSKKNKSKSYIAYIIHICGTYSSHHSSRVSIDIQNLKDYTCTWSVLRRFNEFKVLDDMLRILVPKSHYQFIPNLPTKSTLLGTFKQEFINSRMNYLQTYLQQVTTQLFGMFDQVKDLVLSFFGVEGSPISHLYDKNSFLRVCKWLNLTLHSTIKSPSSPVSQSNQEKNHFANITTSPITSTTTLPSSTVDIKHHEKDENNFKVFEEQNKQNSDTNDPVFLLDEFISHYQQVRTQKSKVKGLLEEHRQLLIDFEQQKHIDQDKMVDWYDQYYKTNDKLKSDLIEARLLGDVFIVEWESDPYVFNISAESKVYLYPVLCKPADGNKKTLNRTKSSNSLLKVQIDDISLEDTSVTSILGREEKKYIMSAGGHKEAFLVDEISLVSQIDNTFVSNGLETVLLEMKNGDKYLFKTQEKHELTEVLGAHLTRLKKQRISLVSCLSQYEMERKTPYDPENIEHETVLFDLWKTVFPDEVLKERKTKQWEQLGFQGDDPATDFRAMGLLGLKLLVYFAKRHTKQFRQILEADRGYPLSCSCINVAHALLVMLQTSQKKFQLKIAPQDSSWDSKLFMFLCLPSHGTENGRSALEEVFCIFCLLVDKIWTEKKATYMQYHAILNEAKFQLEAALMKRPTSLIMLEHLVKIIK